MAVTDDLMYPDPVLGDVRMPHNKHNDGDDHYTPFVKIVPNSSDDTPIDGGANGLYVDVRAMVSLPAGTASIGSVAIEGEILAGGSNANIHAAVYDSAMSTPTGIVAMFQRDDVLASLSCADGDATFARTNANGAIWSAVSGTVELGAGSAKIGSVVQEVAKATVDGVELEVKRAYLQTSSGSSTEVVAAVASKKIRVLSLDITTSSGVTVTVLSAATTLMGSLNSSSFIPVKLNPGVGYVCETAVNEALNVDQSGTASMCVFVTYVEVS